MSPNEPGNPVKAKVIASNNLYTAILALAFALVLVTAAFVAFKCYTQYGTIFVSQ